MPIFCWRARERSRHVAEQGLRHRMFYRPEHGKALLRAEGGNAGVRAIVWPPGRRRARHVHGVWLCLARVARADARVAGGTLFLVCTGFVIVERKSQSAIGFLGFKGPCDDEQVVEVAYGIVPTFQGRGLATEALEIGVAFAFLHGAIGCVRAQTLRENAASQRVLAKGGFTYIGEVVDPEDGCVARWELTRADADGVVMQRDSKPASENVPTEDRDAFMCRNIKTLAGFAPTGHRGRRFRRQPCSSSES